MHKLLTILLIIFFLLLISIKFWLINIPEFIPIGSEIGEIVENTAISYIAAYIFYLLQVWYPNRLKEKKARLKFISPLKNIKGDLKSILKIFFDLEKQKGQKITYKDIEHINLLAKKAPISFAVGVNSLKKADYVEFIQLVHTQIKSHISKIENWNDFDFQLKDLLEKIDNSKVFSYTKDVNVTLKTLLPSGIELSPIAMADSLNDLYSYYTELNDYIIDNENKIKKNI
ncbi:hypothetical protein [Solibacillus daqui]|uniref:hypothetical protein n=1 Tax=Solibacillus daqui TaxID=2912187 RepID=UPI0023652428|nr:hypothetical protein [Solibacillus daqui]